MFLTIFFVYRYIALKCWNAYNDDLLLLMPDSRRVRLAAGGTDLQHSNQLRVTQTFPHEKQKFQKGSEHNATRPSWQTNNTWSISLASSSIYRQLNHFSVVQFLCVHIRIWLYISMPNNGNDVKNESFQVCTSKNVEWNQKQNGLIKIGGLKNPTFFLKKPWGGFFHPDLKTLHKVRRYIL